MFKRYLSSAVIIHAVAFVAAISVFGSQDWQSSLAENRGVASDDQKIVAPVREPEVELSVALPLANEVRPGDAFVQLEQQSRFR